MHEIRLQVESEPTIVVRGASRLVEVWPTERHEPVLARTGHAAEIGDVDAVVAVLAAVEGEDPATYRARHDLSAPALRALTAHCRAAILEAAVRVVDDLSPEAVLAAVHEGLRRPIDTLLERVAS